MLTHDYIALQITKAHQSELIQERKNDSLLKFVYNEAKARLQERIERKKRPIR